MALSADLTARHRIRINGILNTTTITPAARRLRVLGHILDTETENGTQFVLSDGTLYVFLGLTHEILNLSSPSRPSDRVMSYLNQLYGITQVDPLGKFVYASLRDHALAIATKADLRRFAVYSPNTMTAYLSSYDGRMWRIDGGTPEIVHNGEDDIYFIDDDGGVPIEPDIGPHGILLDTLTSLSYTAGIGGITPEQQRMAFTAWIFALAFPDLQPTKPLLILEGDAGSGKSAGLQLLQYALLGMTKPMILNRHKSDDFGVVLLRSPIALFDNTDSYIEWLADEICAYATQGSWAKRQLYTDSNEVKLKPHAFIAVASKNPASFRREDVVDRLVIMRMERRKTFTKFAELKRRVLTQRAQLVGEYIWYVNEIVHYLRTTAGDETHDETTRMADFAAFVRIVGDLLHWKSSDVDSLLTALEVERTTFVNEADSLCDLLLNWIGYKRTNPGREMTLFELFAELEIVAKTSGMQFYKTTNQLGQKLRSPHVAEEFIVQTGARAGRKTFKIWRKGDPQFSLVPPDDGEAPLSYPATIDVE